MKKILTFVITLAIFALSTIAVYATETEVAEVTEAVTSDAITTEAMSESVVVTEATNEETDTTINYTEALKLVLVVLAESETKSEAVNRIVEANIVPNASIGDIVDLVDSFEEMSEYWDCKECLMYSMVEGLAYGLEENWINEYINTYFPDLPESCYIWNAEPSGTNSTLDSEAISEVIDIIETSDSKAEAVLAVVKLLGVSTEEAEEIINALIAVGDEYLGQSDAWVGFKKDVQENMKFWAVVIACLASVITIAGVIFVFIGRVNPELAR